MGLNDGGVFVTQKANKRRAGHAHQDAVDADQLEEMVAGVAQTSQSTLLLKKKKEMREVSPSVDCGRDEGVWVCMLQMLYFEWFVSERAMAEFNTTLLPTRRCL